MSNAPLLTYSEPRADLEAFNGFDELNLAEFPLAVLGERPEGIKTLEFCDTLYDHGAKKEITRKLTVTGSELYGLPSHLDEDVLVVMMYLTNQLKFQTRTIHFSRYHLIELLGWSHGGKSYERLAKSLHRWIGVTLYYENAWWNKNTKKWVDQSFHLLSNLILHDRRSRGEQSELPLSSFTWNEVVFDSFLARNTKALDLNDYFSLKLAPAKRMYRFLDKRFGAQRGNVWTFDLREFACEHIGFSRGYDSAQLKRKIKPSIEELEQHGFLKPMDETERYPKGERRGQHYIVVEKAEKEESEQPEIQAETKPALSPLEAALIARGVTATVAAKLVDTFAAEQITARLEILDWLIETKDKWVSKSPTGYLVKSIKDNYAAPAGYTPKAEREKQKQSAEDRKRRTHEAEKARWSQEEEELSARKHQRAQIERYLASLSADEKKALEDRALAAAEPDERERAQKGEAFADTMRCLLVDRQVLKECPLAVELGSP